jgi:hypothetical protein
VIFHCSPGSVQCGLRFIFDFGQSNLDKVDNSRVIRGAITEGIKNLVLPPMDRESVTVNGMYACRLNILVYLLYITFR